MIEINEERFMFGFLGVTLVMMIGIVLSSKDALDVVYLLMVIYSFIKFLVIREDWQLYF